MRRIWLAMLMATPLMLGVPATAWGQGQAPNDQTRAAARTLAEEGDAAWEKGDWATALDKFSRANALVFAPPLALREAECLVKMGKLVEASERYTAIGNTPLDDKASQVFKDAVAKARTEADALRARLPNVELVVEGEGTEQAQVLVDGKEVPRALWGAKLPLNPGTHKVELVAGDKKASQDVTVAEKEVKRVVLKFETAAAAAAPVPVPAPTPAPAPVAAPPPVAPAPAPAAAEPDKLPAKKPPASTFALEAMFGLGGRVDHTASGYSDDSRGGMLLGGGAFFAPSRMIAVGLTYAGMWGAEEQFAPGDTFASSKLRRSYHSVLANLRAYPLRNDKIGLWGGLALGATFQNARATGSEAAVNGPTVTPQTYTVEAGPKAGLALGLGVGVDYDLTESVGVLASFNFLNHWLTADSLTSAPERPVPGAGTTSMLDFRIGMQYRFDTSGAALPASGSVKTAKY